LGDSQVRDSVHLIFDKTLESKKIRKKQKIVETPEKHSVPRKVRLVSPLVIIDRCILHDSHILDVHNIRRPKSCHLSKATAKTASEQPSSKSSEATVMMSASLMLFMFMPFMCQEPTGKDSGSGSEGCTTCASWQFSTELVLQATKESLLRWGSCRSLCRRTILRLLPVAWLRRICRVWWVLLDLAVALVLRCSIVWRRRILWLALWLARRRALRLALRLAEIVSSRLGGIGWSGWIGRRSLTSADSWW